MIAAIDRLSSAIAPLVARSSNSPTQQQRRTTGQYTLPPQQSIKNYNLINLYISLPSSDSQRKESQLVSPVLLLLRRTIVFREGLWSGMSDSVLFINITTRTDLSDNEKPFFSIDLH